MKDVARFIFRGCDTLSSRNFFFMSNHKKNVIKKKMKLLFVLHFYDENLNHNNAQTRSQTIDMTIASYEL